MSYANLHQADETRSQLLNGELNNGPSPPPRPPPRKSKPSSTPKDITRANDTGSPCYDYSFEQPLRNPYAKKTENTSNSTCWSSCHDKVVGILCKRRGWKFYTILTVILIVGSMAIVFVAKRSASIKEDAETLLPSWTEDSAHIVDHLLTTTEPAVDTHTLPPRQTHMANEPPSSKQDCPKVSYSESMQYHDIQQCNPSSILEISIDSNPNFSLSELPQLAPQLRELKIKLGDKFCPPYPDTEIRLPTLQNLTIFGSEVCGDNSPVFMIRAPNLVELRLRYLRVVSSPFREKIMELLKEPCDRVRGTLRYFYIGYSSFYKGGQFRGVCRPDTISPREKITELV